MQRVLAAPFDVMLGRVVATLIGRHPRLPQQLRRIPPAALLIAPSDLPFRFLIETGAAGLSLRAVLPGEQVPAATRLGAPIKVLIALAESRMDADAIFFERTLAVDGDIEPVLALRNVIESEAIDIAEIVLTALGPLGSPARHLGAAAHDALGILGPLLETARADLLRPVLNRLDALERAVNRLAGAAAAPERRERSYPTGRES